MAFFSGRVTFTRFRVLGRSPGMFGPEHLERLERFAAGKSRLLTSDGTNLGWTAGDHILDTSFCLEKNVVEDTLHFALRCDSQRIPADLLRAYFLIELEALAKGNPSGVPSARQKREARETARQRLEDEARDGRFLRRQAVPVLWDARANELLIGATAATAFDRLHTLFEQTFGQSFEPLSAGLLAFRLAEPRRRERAVDDAAPSPFAAGASAEVAWVPDEASRDFLGNEFLLWLWYVLDAESDTLRLSDGSDVVLMVMRTLVLECPRGRTGRQSITSEAPTRLPEARRALQGGKLPRKAGLTLVRHDQQYDLTLHAESLAVAAARLPAPEAVEERARQEERVGQLRHLLETLDLIYEVFVKHRAGGEWAKELAKVQQWLRRGERAGRGATG